MALGAGRKAEIAQRLRVASTWVGGPRSEELLALSIELEDDVDPDEALEKATAKLAAESAAAAAPTEEQPGEDDDEPKAKKSK